MRSRDYDLRIAMAELGFALTAFACGLFEAPAFAAGLVCVAMIAYWGHARRAILNRLPVGTWARLICWALVVIIAIEAGAYWLGLGIGERLS